jgi:hypothetical protein
MLKNELREKGFDGQEKIPSGWIIGLLWVALAVIMITLSIQGSLAAAAAIGISAESELNYLMEFNENVFDFMGDVSPIIILFVLCLVLYFAFKCIVSRLFCEGKNSVDLVMKNAVPMCLCREALKIWQIVLIHVIPGFIIYVPLFILSVFSAFDKGYGIYSTNIIILSLFISLDLTLVVYISFIKMITRAEYISIDRHIYNITLFNKIADNREETAPEEIMIISELSDAEEYVTGEKEENISIQTAPGQNFLKLTGILYVILGGITAISALMARFTFGGHFWLPAWRFSAVNIVFYALEKVYMPICASEPLIMDFYEEFVYQWYAGLLRFPIIFEHWGMAAIGGIVSTFIAVIMGIFIVFMGITAVKYCATLKRTKLLFIFGLIHLGIMIISTILLFSLFAVLGCVIAVLYFMGAFKNYRQIYLKE